MATIKQMEFVAEEIAENIIDEMYKQCDWQIGQFLPPESEGDTYSDAHSYLMRLVANHIDEKLLNK